jgi:hypothetical protein
MITTRRRAELTIGCSIAPVVACEIADKLPMSEIAIAVRKGNRASVVGNFRSRLRGITYISAEMLKLRDWNLYVTVWKNYVSYQM